MRPFTGTSTGASIRSGLAMAIAADGFAGSAHASTIRSASESGGGLGNPGPDRKAGRAHGPIPTHFAVLNRPR